MNNGLYNGLENGLHNGVYEGNSNGVNDGLVANETNADKIVTAGLILNIDANNPKSYNNGETKVYDISGNGLVGTSSGTFTSSVSGVRFWNFNGTNTSLNFGSSMLLKPQRTFTICFWAKPTLAGGGAYQTIFSYPSIFKLNIKHSSVGTGSLIISYSSGFKYAIYSAPVNWIASEKWYQFTFVVNYSSLANSFLYVNNSKIPQSDSTFIGTTLLPAPTTGNTVISSGDEGQYYNGKLGNFLMYNRILSVEEIGVNYEAYKNRYINQ